MKSVLLNGDAFSVEKNVDPSLMRQFSVSNGVEWVKNPFTDIYPSEVTEIYELSLTKKSNPKSKTHPLPYMFKRNEKWYLCGDEVTDFTVLEQ